MNKANECTCPSGDGSLVHPCPAHPAVEQVGGDERAAFELFVRKHCGMPAHIAVNWDAKFTNDAWEGWKARAALAQPSPASELDPLNLAPHAEAFNEAPAEALKPEQEQAEEERPPQPERYTADVFHPERPYYMAQTSVVRASDFDEFATQYERIVGALRAELETERMRLAGCGVAALGYFDGCADAYKSASLSDVLRLRADCDAALAEVERIKAISDNYYVLCVERQQQLDTALARVASLESKLAELEKQEPVGVMRASSEMGVAPYADIWPWLEPGQKLYTTPVAQAQQLNDLDKQCRDDVARALGLRPNQERGFAWSYLLASIKSCVKASEDSAQAQHSVPETTNEEANSFLRVADAGQFKDNAVAVRTAAVIIRSLLHRPALMQSIIRHRIGLTPEYEGQWHADLYGEDGEVQHHAEADTPDEAVRAVVALAAAPSQAQHSVPEGWVQSLPLKDHQPCKPNEDRANGYTIPIYSRPVLVEEALRKLRAVLCDPIGNVVIDGSDGDREEVQRALGMLAAAPGKEGV